ncbi:uncharacterized protein LOC143203076 isoform X2 [Rhynchophorus ferrugineus]|uniref:uncharacterized protein LOC143203076 isoform X2 n=1 Tax=Rhynchophorus ferrugineus TaxID=354439 RepID=UPI003FCDDE3C
MTSTIMGYLFLMSEFFMEQLITDFWFPLEKCVLDSLPSAADRIEEWFSDDVEKVDIITEKLRSKTVGYYVSYTMAISLLLGTLHASRTIDLRTLKDDGPVAFFKEIIHKIKLQKRRFLRKLGYGKKKVKINECPRFDRTITAYGNNNRQCVNRSDLHNNGKINKYCPVHNPRSDDSGDYSDFEELHKYLD